MLMFLLALLLTSSAPSTATSESDTDFVYGGCNQQKFSPSSSYQISLNTLLTTIVHSSSHNIYNSFNISAASTATAYGLFQCRGDMASACSPCVSMAVSQLGTLCPDSYGAWLQLEGCLVKYDSLNFIGAEDKTLVVNRCGPSQYDKGLGPTQQVLECLSSQQSGYYRVADAGNTKGVGQCVGDLSGVECQGCLNEAVGRLRSECGGAKWGDMFLVKCYARFASSGGYEPTPVTGGTGGSGYGYGNDLDSDDTNSHDGEIQQKLAIIIGIIVAVALVVLCLSCLNKHCDSDGGHNCK